MAVSYAAEEVSQQDANPVQLFVFARGSQTWRYVPGTVPFLISGLSAPLNGTYTPEVAMASAFVRTGDVPKDTLQITLPKTNPMASAFLSYSPNAVTAVTVYRTSYTGAPAGEIEFMGRVLNSSTTVATITLNCENAFTSTRRQALRLVYSRQCQNQLFGPGCNVDPAGYATTITITRVVGAAVTLYAMLDPIFLGGNIRASDGTLMKIVEQPFSNSIILMRPVARLIEDMVTYPSGFTVTAYRGCDKSTGTCHTVFGNRGNFKGFPGLTGLNPFSGSTNVF